MSASDALGIQFYHASPEEFKPGDTLLPGAQTGNMASEYTGKKAGRNQHVWMNTDPQHALDYGPYAYVYHVHPESPKAKRERGESTKNWVAPKATVLRRLTKDELKGRGSW